MVCCARVLFFFVVMSSANLHCFAHVTKQTSDACPLTESCYVQYLRGKGKLAAPQPSTVQPQSLRTQHVIAYLRIIYFARIADRYAPKVADCVKDETVNGELFDYALKLYLHERFLIDVTQLEETNRNFTSLLNQMIVRCKINERYADKTSTLEDYQLDYCLQKYGDDRQLIKSQFGDISRFAIDLGSANCTAMVAVERSLTESQFKDKVDASDCAVNQFRSGNLFDWKIVVTKFPGVYSAFNRIDKLAEEFLSGPASECEV